MSTMYEELESNSSQKVEEFKVKVKEQFNATKDAWLLNGFYDYYLQTSSIRAVDVIVSVKEPHDKHFFDRALDGVKGSSKLQHLTLLGYVVRKRPIWLYKIMSHGLFKEILRILKTESDIVTVVSALLILNILIPSIPSSLGRFLQDIFEVFSKLAAMNANSNNYHEAQLVHLQISLYTLFHRLYGMFPCNFVAFLRKEYLASEGFPVFSHTVKPMLDTVRVNPLLITATKDWETTPSRWKNVESHDIIVSCAKLLMNGGSPTHESSHSVYEPKSLFNCKDMLGALKVSGKQSVADYCKQLSKVTEDVTLWSPSARFHETNQRYVESTPTMIPLTPISRGYEVSSPYSEHEGSSPPEAAIEATPETTPIRDHLQSPAPLLITAPSVAGCSTRSMVSFPMTSDAAGFSHGSKVPITDRSFPSSPIKREASSSAFRYSAPEIQPVLSATVPPPQQPPLSLKKVDKLLNDRCQVAAQENVIELNPFGVPNLRNTNDLNSNFHQDKKHTTISSGGGGGGSVSTFGQYPSRGSNVLVCERDRKENKVKMAAESNNINNENHLTDNILQELCDGGSTTVASQAVDDFEPCEQEQSGSPCSSGGLHMPDSRSLCNFAMHMKHIRIRHSSQCYSDTGRFSTGNSPKDGINYFDSVKVRRTSSCPDIKKSSPSNTFSLGPYEKPRKTNHTLHEKDEENESNDVVNNSIHIVTETVAAALAAPPQNICTTGTQTDEIPPFNFPYEHLFLDVFPPLHQNAGSSFVENASIVVEEQKAVATPSSWSVYENAQSPSRILQSYVDAAVQCHNNRRQLTDSNTNKALQIQVENRFIRDQLKLMETKLQLEEHRREIHAERNRRLLGRSRRNKTLEEHNNALKDQVVLLQKEIENSSDEIIKIVMEKESHVQREQSKAVYWQDQYMELQKEHKKISEQHQDAEIELEELKTMNVKEKKILHQTQANIVDLSNELKLYQKEAKAAKELRLVVADLQTEILKAGELIATYRNKLIEYIPLSTNHVQQEMLSAAYLEELERLNKFLSSKIVSLDASREMVKQLKAELAVKEKNMEKLTEMMGSAREKEKKEIKELQEKYEEMKKRYSQELEKSNDLQFRLTIAKRVNKISQQPPRSTLDYRTTVRLSAAHNSADVTENSASSSSESSTKPTQGILKSPKRFFNIHSEKYKLDLCRKTADAPPVAQSNTAQSANVVSSSLLPSSPAVETAAVAETVVATSSAAGPSSATETSLASSSSTVTAAAVAATENVDIFKPIVKKKGRMECAESGQLKPISITFLDTEQSGSGSGGGRKHPPVSE